MKAAVCRALLLPMVCTLLSGCSGLFDSEAEAALREKLREPGSVNFRNITRCKASGADYFGEASAANGQGGMTGFGAFYFVGGKVEVDDTLRPALTPNRYAPTDPGPDSIWTQQPRWAFYDASAHCSGGKSETENAIDTSNAVGRGEVDAGAIERATDAALKRRR